MCKIYIQQSSKSLGVHLKVFTRIKIICGLNHIPSITNDVDSLITGLSALWISLLWKEYLCVLLIFFKKMDFLFLINLQECLKYSEYELSIDTFIPTIFSRYVTCIFIVLMESFDEQKFLILLNNWSIIFSWLFVCVCVCPVQKYLLKENCLYTHNTSEWHVLNFFPSNQPISQSWNTNQVSYNLTQFWH